MYVVKIFACVFSLSTGILAIQCLPWGFVCVGKKLSKKFYDLSLRNFYHVPLFFRKVQELESAD